MRPAPAGNTCYSGRAFDLIQDPVYLNHLVDPFRLAIQTGGSRRHVKEAHETSEQRTKELQRTLEGRTRELDEATGIAQSPLRWLINGDQRMQKVIQQVKQVADSPLTILVQGETGTGKELVARAIHQLSNRSQKPFVAADCGAIPETLAETELFGHEKGTGADQRKEGRFQLAKDGVLFLDEIGNLPLSMQAKLPVWWRSGRRIPLAASTLFKSMHGLLRPPI